MISRRIVNVVAPLAVCAAFAATPSSAYMAIPPTFVGPPAALIDGTCTMAFARPGGGGPGAAIPFAALALGAPVARTTTSFPTGGGGTSNAAIAEQRKRMGLPYAPPTINPQSAALPATFAIDRGTGVASAVFQRMPLTAAKGVAEPYGMIFAQATSATRGRIAGLILSIAGRPASPPRLRVTTNGPAERGCQRQTVQIYAPAMSAAALGSLFGKTGKRCHWASLASCPRAQWPRGRVLFVSPLRDNIFEYRWVDYDLLAAWHFAKVG